MPRISIRIFVDDAEFDRVDEDLPAEVDAREIVDECRRCVEASKPLTAEETAEMEEGLAALSRQHDERRRQAGGRSLEERRRREEAAAVRMLQARGWRLEKPD
jgi:hypothetical protein